jgi:hypothetical protein
VLSARFLFDWQTEKKELLDVRAYGPGVFGRRDKFAEEVARHREWSDEEVVKAMNEAGAKFGPEHKAELLRALPLEGLAPFMDGGKGVSLNCAIFPETLASAEALPGICLGVNDVSSPASLAT